MPSMASFLWHGNNGSSCLSHHWQSHHRRCWNTCSVYHSLTYSCHSPWKQYADDTCTAMPQDKVENLNRQLNDGLVHIQLVHGWGRDLEWRQVTLLGLTSLPCIWSQWLHCYYTVKLYPHWQLPLLWMVLPSLSQEIRAMAIFSWFQYQIKMTLKWAMW